MTHVFTPEDVARAVRYRGRRDVAAFWERVDRSSGPDACWPWMGARKPRGYGYLQRSNRSIRAHRVALEITLGRPLADGEEAAHRCDNPPCCNPAHLFVATHADNMADMVAKGRSAAGERNRGFIHGRSPRPRPSRG